MAWEIVTGCVAANYTQEQPAVCICEPETTGSEVIGQVYGFDCVDCGQWGYTTASSAAGNRYGCCSMVGTVHEEPI